MRSSRIVWVKLVARGSHRFRLNFPLPLYTFTQLLESFEDLLAVICFLAPRRTETDAHHPTVHDIKDLLSMASGLIKAMGKDGPYELVHVSHDEVELSLKIR